MAKSKAKDREHEELNLIEQLATAAITGILAGFVERGLTMAGVVKLLAALLAIAERRKNDGKE